MSYMIYEYHNLLCATTLCQVKAMEQELKHKLRPANAFLKAKGTTTTTCHCSLERTDQRRAPLFLLE